MARLIFLLLFAFGIQTLFVSEVYAQKKQKEKKEKKSKKSKTELAGDEELTINAPKKDKKKKKKKKKKKSKKGEEVEVIEELAEEVVSDFELYGIKEDELLNTIDSLKGVIVSLNQESSMMKQTINELIDNSEVIPESLKTTSGLAFRVQIGAFVKYSSNLFKEDSKPMLIEHSGSLNKYSIGYFETLKEAKACEKYMKKLGIKDAWLVPFFNGKRISDEKAESILGQSFRDK